MRWMAPVEFDMSNMSLLRIAGSKGGDVQLPFNYVNTPAFNALAGSASLFVSFLSSNSKVLAKHEHFY